MKTVGDYRELTCEGSVMRLYVTALNASCGEIEDGDGVGFAFGMPVDDERVRLNGGWVVPIDELREIVEAAENLRALRAAASKAGES